MSEFISTAPEDLEPIKLPDTTRETEEADGEEAADLTNPAAYVQEFEEAINFPDFVQQRAARSTEPLSPEEIRELADNLRTSEEYKNRLWDWQKLHPLPYNRDNFPPEARIALAKYWEEVVKIRHNKGRWDASEILHHDYERSFLHTSAANDLIRAGLAPNRTIGRLLIHFMSIEKGLDVEDPGRDERRVQAFM